MASGNLKMSFELRPCLVNGKKALFHTWEHYSVGDIKNVAGIIEAENGQVIKVNPTSIQFIDNKIENYCFNESR